MRLIDADSLKKELKERYSSDDKYAELFGVVDNQPTAYNVEKVVEQLEENALKTLGITKEQFHMDKGEYEGYCSLSLSEVKSAIRNGGKE